MYARREPLRRNALRTAAGFPPRPRATGICSFLSKAVSTVGSPARAGHLFKNDVAGDCVRPANNEVVIGVSAQRDTDVPRGTASPSSWRSPPGTTGGRPYPGRKDRSDRDCDGDEHADLREQSSAGD